jgi:hypothetical protein
MYSTQSPSGGKMMGVETKGDLSSYKVSLTYKWRSVLSYHASDCFKVASPVGDFIRRCRNAEIPAPGVSREIVGNERRVIEGG